MTVNETRLAISRLIVGAIEWDDCKIHRDSDNQLEKRLHMDVVKLKEIMGCKDPVQDFEKVVAFIEQEVGPITENP
jgi:hypothetical protein